MKTVNLKKPRVLDKKSGLSCFKLVFETGLLTRVFVHTRRTGVEKSERYQMLLADSPDWIRNIARSEGVI